eukprot:scaffold83310_cov25-Tisochrysis_lutea.AAC.2
MPTKPAAVETVNEPSASPDPSPEPPRMNVCDGSPCSLHGCAAGRRYGIGMRARGRDAAHRRCTLSSSGNRPRGGVQCAYLELRGSRLDPRVEVDRPAGRVDGSEARGLGGRRPVTHNTKLREGSIGGCRKGDGLGR